MSTVVSPRPSVGQMKSSQSIGLVQRHPLASFVFLALALSWLVELPLIGQVQGWWKGDVPFALHYLASFGPMVAAIVLSWKTGGGAGLRELWSRITRWRVSRVSAAFALLSPVVLFLLSALVVRMTTGRWPDFVLLGQINYMPYLGVWALLLWIVTFGFGEETGWRGFALPRLQKSHSALTASLILWLIWIVWHIPAFFYLDTYMNMGLAMFPVFALSVLAGTVVLTWLYNTANGSVLMLALWHGVFDFLSASKVSEGMIAAVMSAVIMVMGIAIVLWFKPTNLSSADKQTL